MPKPKPDPARETRTNNEIVVDAYNESERAMGWHCHLEDELGFPFNARCIASRTISPLKKGEEVVVIAIAHADDCAREMFVRDEFSGRKIGGPLEVPIERLAVPAAGEIIVCADRSHHTSPEGAP